MGSTSTLLMLDLDAARERVLPAIRRWLEDDDLVAWRALCDGARWGGPEPDDRSAWVAWSDWSEWLAVTAANHDVGLLPEPDRRLDTYTLMGLEMAIASATVGAGLPFGNSRWLPGDLLDEYDPVLNPLPNKGSRLVALIERLNGNLLAFNGGHGGWGEGLRGFLDPRSAAELDDELTAHGSRAVQGRLSDIYAAVCAAGADPNGVLGQNRRTLVIVHAMASRARRWGLGLLHGRSLPLEHLGAWVDGVFFRVSPQRTA